MTELIKKEGVVSKVRHKIYNGEHTVSFYLDKTQVYMKHYAPIPAENGDEIAVSGYMDDSGLLKVVALKNAERNAFLPGKNMSSGAGCSMIVYAVASFILVLSLTNLHLGDVLIGPVIGGLVLIYFGHLNKKAGKKRQAAIDLISD